MLAANSATIGAIVATYGMLSMIPDTGTETPRIHITVSNGFPPVASVASRARWAITPVFASAPTMMNNPAKNSSVSHSTLVKYSDVCSLVIRISTPAPSSATMDGAMCSAECAMNAANTANSTTPHLISRAGSPIASRSSSDITSATRSASTSNEPRNSLGSINTHTAITITTIGSVWTRKSLNDRPARLAMMMFGGSPTNVDAPPMLDANTSAIRNGAARTSSLSHISRVTGATSRTVVTLSSSADATAVTSTSRIMIRTGDPLARLAAHIAMYSKTPVWRSTDTITIIPNSRKMTSQSIPVSREKNTSSDATTPSAARTAAPESATTVLLTRSLAMNT